MTNSTCSTLYNISYKICSCFVEHSVVVLSSTLREYRQLYPRVRRGCVTGTSQITKFMRPTWGPPGSCRSQMGPMLAPWTCYLGWYHREWVSSLVPSASEATNDSDATMKAASNLIDMGNFGRYLNTTNHRKKWQVCIFFYSILFHFISYYFFFFFFFFWGGGDIALTKTTAIVLYSCWHCNTPSSQLS